MSALGNLIQGAEAGAGGKGRSHPKPQPSRQAPPRKTGVFAHGPLTDPLNQRVSEARDRVRQAAEKMPGQAVNVGRIPHGRLNQHQRQVLIRHQESRVKQDIAQHAGAKSFTALMQGHGNQAAGADRAREIKALENLGDSSTRAALHQLSGAETTSHRIDLGKSLVDRLPQSRPGGLSDHALNVLGAVLQRHGADAPPPGMDAGLYAGTSKRKSEMSTAQTMGIPDTPVLSTAANAFGSAVHGITKVAPYALAAPIALAPGKVGDTFKNAFKDAGDLAIGALPSVYQTGKIGYDIASGSGKGADELNQLGAQMRDQTMLGKLFTQGPGAALKQAQAHPLMSALELSGAEGAIGRGLGMAGRSGVLGEDLARAAGTAREAKAITGDVADIRHYSGDVARKGAQKLGEAFQRARGKNPDVATGAEAVRLGRRQMRQTTGANEVARREARNAAGHLMDHLQPGALRVRGAAPDVTEGAGINAILGRMPRVLRVRGHQHSDLIPGMAVMKLVRSPETLREDLLNYRQVVQDTLDRDAAIADRKNPGQPGYLFPDEARKGRETLKRIDAALSDEKFLKNPHEFFTAAQGYNTLRGAVDQLKEELNIQTPAQTAARDLPALQVHAGAERVELPEHIRGLQREFQAASAALKQHAATGDPFDLVEGLGKQADHLRSEIVKEGYDPEALPSGWVIQGHPISIEDARTLLHEIGAGGAGFLSHNPSKIGRGAFFKPSIRYPSAEGGPRTGRLLGAGAVDMSSDALKADLAGAVGTVEQARRFERTATRYLTGRPDGTPWTGPDAWHLASKAAEEMNNADRDLEMVPFNLSPLMDAAQGKDAWGLGHTDTDAYKAAEEMWSRVSRPGAGGSPVALIPRKLLEDWQKGSVGVGGPKALQMLLQNFKRTVLPFSTKWIAGNQIEAGLRSALYGHGPMDWLRGRKFEKVLEQHDRTNGTDFLHTWRAYTHGGHFSSIDQNQIHRTLEDLRGSNPVVYHTARAVAPVAHALEKTIGKLRDGSLHLNSAMEREWARAALGAKLAKDVRETAGSFLKAGVITEKVLKDYLDGHLVDKHGNLDENRLADVGRYMMDALGRYGAHGPIERAVIQTYLPFWDWTRNALKFVFWTLPAHHPVKTGILTALVEANRKELDAEGQHLDSSLPSYLLGGIKKKDGSVVDIAHYTPFGIAQDPVGIGEQLFAPQFLAPALAGAGVNWKLQQMKNNSGGQTTQLDRLGALVNQFAGSQVPLLSTAQRAREGGGSPTDLSNVFSPHTRAGTKPKSLGALLSKLFNPLASRQPGGQQGRKANPWSSGWGGGSSGWSSGGWK